MTVRGLMWLSASFLVLASACSTSSATHPSVTTDPKTLVLQPGDYPSNWDSGVVYPSPTGGPADGLGHRSRTGRSLSTPYYYFIPFQNCHGRGYALMAIAGTSRWRIARRSNRDAAKGSRG